MDARDRLRRYLEQRREMGESDLVLDTMSIEDVLKLVGDKPRGGVARVDESQRQPAQSARTIAPPNSDNWRETLRSAGGAPSGEETKMPSPKRRVTEPAAPPVPAVSSTVAPVDEAPAAPIELAKVPIGISVGKPAPIASNDIAQLPSLEAIAEMVRQCTRCPLHATAKHGVPGEGSPTARFVCVGEAPGATEDETGRPFVGAAGQLLTKILAAIGLPREDVFICNVIKHRPPGNRNPLPNEIAACSPYLVRQLELIRPGVILALGTFAAQTLLETKESIGKLRGKIHRYHGIPLVVTYHPAALLRNPSWKRPTWDDVQLARRILDSSPLAGA